MKIYKRSIDTHYRCVVRMASGRPVHRGTGCRTEDSALKYAGLLQRDIQRRAELGDLLPPKYARPKRRKKK
ncbi:MAG: hypothetical protein WCS65_09470 [Verrucomicrobiae bacterium]